MIRTPDKMPISILVSHKISEYWTVFRTPFKIQDYIIFNIFAILIEPNITKDSNNCFNLNKKTCDLLFRKNLVRPRASASEVISEYYKKSPIP